MRLSLNSMRTKSAFLLFALLIGMIGPAATVSAEPWKDWQQPTNYANNTVVTVTNQVKMPGAKRFGINIGSYDQYGAAQYMRNLIPNPGFEAAEMSMLFLASPTSTGKRIQPHRWDGIWNGHPAGFWDGGTYEFLSGVNKGRTGKIERFALEGGLYTFYLGGYAVKPNLKDVVVVRKQFDGYHTETPTPHHTPEPNERRPGSPGIQSLRVRSSGWNPGFAVPFDSFARDADKSAGKLNVVEGIWKFELWVKPTKPGQVVEIKFLRHRENIFFNTQFELHQGWQKIERKFIVPEGLDRADMSGKNPLAFELRVASDDGDVLIDDAELTRIDTRYNTAFSDHFVDLLRELQPGVIRNWGHQLGNSLDNQIAEPWARRTSDFDPKDSDPVKFHYSLHEFLELARAVNTEPWYVVPPTWSNGELQNLIAYLSAPAGTHPYADKRVALGQHQPWTNVFPKIHLELGNEMWGGNTSGDPFTGATLWDGYHLGEVGGERLSVMRRSTHFKANKMNLILGGQAGFSERQMEIESTSNSHDSIGVAPYFASHISTFGDKFALVRATLARPYQQVQDYGKMYRSDQYVKANGNELVIYEINSHLTHGPMPVAQRNEFLAGLNMGLTMPLHMLAYQAELGVRTQAAFTALQYSWLMPGKYNERAKLWGLLRDSEATGRKRPGWLGMEIVNDAIRGDFVVTEQSGRNPTWNQKPMNEITQQIDVPIIQSYAFKSTNRGYSVVLFNLDLGVAHNVDLRLPFAPNKPATIKTMTGTHIFANNEDRENVKIETTQQYLGQNSTLKLPKHSIVTVSWD